MGKFDGILICTDLDGTLLNSQGKVAKENTEAIEYFKSEGGYFTFITGRMPFFVDSMYNAVRPNAPIGCVNGAGLYDYPNQRYILTATMGEGVNELIRAVDTNVPYAGIQVNTYYNTFFCKENETMKYFRDVTGLPNLVCHYTEVKEPIGKIIFGSQSDEEIEEIQKILLSHPMADRFDFVRSERTLFEILPKNIGKGVAIKNLVNHLGIDPNRTVALGDYNNDISMFREAKYGIAVANACDDAKKAADFITVSNDEHAVARVINDIEKGIYKF